ncbi:hypothetical protein DMH04_15495 [Kibdelosporangium aridum]|uniref:Bacterial bifunctional deaminase-reductase C-terminal domain-containing protein n=1 Tax=Kibdelosporangium aridum TaxID=2030 RepID=A0A428ZDM2_KIBAR|nr:dihydrofolate reductase family protein [Kibdelosporangium aridum]RSM86068.1 hypothetical protein DMH04_15495 [Kibdelosporangium aridum]
MRRLINSTYITLDGVIQDPQDWPAGEVDDPAGGTIQSELLFACDAVLMGRHTYESFAPVWQSRTGDPFSDRMNSMRKYVVSTTLQDPDWANTTVISSDPVAEVKRLKALPGQDIVQYGFGDVAYALLEHGLIDELRLWVHPFFVGKSGPMYREAPLAKFDLADVKPLKSGIVVLTYHAR